MSVNEVVKVTFEVVEKQWAQTDIPSTFKSDLNRNSQKKGNKATVKSKNDLLESKEVAERVVKAEKSGKDILFIPFKSRLFLLLESLFHPIFRKMFLK